MSKQSLLLVDGDTRSLRVLEVSLRKAGFMVTAALSVQDALDKLELHAPDLIISETAFPDGDGFELRRRVRATPEWSEIPFIFLTAEAALEDKIRGLELGVDDYLTKPIYIKEIVTRINILLQKRQRVRFEERRDGRTRFAGRVQDMPVVDVIQTIEISRKSGVIQFVGERGRQAAIYFRDGRVIDAEAGSLQGEDAVYRLLTWSEGEFEVVFRTVRRREVIAMSSQALLMEGMRRLDEWSRLFEQLPPLGHRFEIDTTELAARLGDVPDDNNRILRLVDGKRTLLEVIDSSDAGDLECLQAISRLYFEELLLDLDQGLEGKPPRRDTGKGVALVEIDGPAPVVDETSGPVVGEPLTPPSQGEVPEASRITAPLAAAGGDLPEGEAAHAANGAANGRGEAPRRAETERGDAEPGDDASGDLSIREAPGERQPEIEEDLDRTPVGPLMGGYRPSSLRLIDEAVAAAQAIEPTLFDDSEDKQIAPEPDQDHEDHEGHRDHEHGHTNGTNGVSHVHGTMNGESGHHPPGMFDADDAAVEAARMSLEAANLRVAEREDSGLRMIGSLGRDRAEASGELATLGHARPLRSETARELVTILPRRITRELPIVPQELAESLPTPTPTASVLVAKPMTAIDLGEPTQRVALPGSGVRAASRSRRLLRLVRPLDGGGPGVVAIVLIALALALAGTAGFLRLRRHGPSSQPSQVDPVTGRKLTASSATGDLPTADPEAAQGAKGLDEPPDRRGGDGIAPAEAASGQPGAVAVAGAIDAGGTRSSADRPGTGSPKSDSGDKAAKPAERASGAAGDKAAKPVSGESAGVKPAADAGDKAKPGEAKAASDGAAKPVPGDRNQEAKSLADQASNALDEGDFAKALQLAASSIKLRRTARGFMLRARAEQRLGKVDDALTSLDAATELAPTSGAVWEQRGRILWAARRRDEARAAFQRFLELAPKAASAPEILRLLNEPR